MGKLCQGSSMLGLVDWVRHSKNALQRTKCQSKFVVWQFANPNFFSLRAKNSSSAWAWAKQNIQVLLGPGPSRTCLHSCEVNDRGGGGGGGRYDHRRVGYWSFQNVLYFSSIGWGDTQYELTLGGGWSPMTPAPVRQSITLKSLRCVCVCLSVCPGRGRGVRGGGPRGEAHNLGQIFYNYFPSDPLKRPSTLLWVPRPLSGSPRPYTLRAFDPPLGAYETPLPNPPKSISSCDCYMANYNRYSIELIISIEVIA